MSRHPPAAGEGGRDREASGYEVVIGLEIHVQLRTATKMFCGCPVEFGAPPNARVCPVCLGLPGALPVANGAAVELAARAAVALGCRIHTRSEFVRKNYFYPDLPKGYQITQFAHPLATGGQVVLRSEGRERRVGVRRLHLEEDAGKSLHDRFPESTAVDLNRAGVPLIEIVTEPELRFPAEARAFLVRLKQLLKHYADVSDCSMEEGSLRVDANLSLRKTGEDRSGTQTEVKNLNSFAFVERALEHERVRQLALLEAGLPVRRETRAFDAVRGETRPLRGKEEEFDYRYFPDPDLPYVEVAGDAVERERRRLGELPHELEKRLAERYRVSPSTAVQLAATPARAAYFEAAVSGSDPDLARTVANFIMGDLAAELNRRSEAGSEAELLPPEPLRRVAELRLEGVLSSDTASHALRHLISGGVQRAAEVDALVRARNLAQVRDVGRLDGWVEEVLAAHPEEVARYAAGEAKLLAFFMGQVMRAAGGRADPDRIRELLARRLAGGAREAREEGREG
ncbi:MAG: Asp-tRNA(Asn)/Glu-tRNA(Gln) amidotransferase subunit GatB [Gemmatimonadota bacterium]